MTAQTPEDPDHERPDEWSGRDQRAYDAEFAAIMRSVGWSAPSPSDEQNGRSEDASGVEGPPSEDAGSTTPRTVPRPADNGRESDRPESGPSESDLSGSDLSGSDLSGSDLSGSDLSASDPSGSDPAGSNRPGLGAARPALPYPPGAPGLTGTPPTHHAHGFRSQSADPVSEDDSGRRAGAQALPTRPVFPLRPVLPPVTPLSGPPADLDDDDDDPEAHFHPPDLRLQAPPPPPADADATYWGMIIGLVGGLLCAVLAIVPTPFGRAPGSLAVLLLCIGLVCAFRRLPRRQDLDEYDDGSRF